MQQEKFHNQISRELGEISQGMKNMHDDIKEIKGDVKVQNGRVHKNEVKIIIIFLALVLIAGLAFSDKLLPLLFKAFI